jgi:hypothetical protein
MYICRYRMTSISLGRIYNLYYYEERKGVSCLLCSAVLPSVNLDRPRVIQPRSAPDPNPLIPLLYFSLALDSPAAPSRLHPDADRTPSAMAGRNAPAPSPPYPSRPTPSLPLHPGSLHGRYHDQRFGGAGAARYAMRQSPTPPDADHLHPELVREVSDFHFFDWMACGRAFAPPCPPPLLRR